MEMRRTVTHKNIQGIVCHNLCVGCGLCSVICPKTAISMAWHSHGVWGPVTDKEKCVQCGQCLRTCPNTPQCIMAYAHRAQSSGIKFGLSNEASYFIAYDKDPTKRIRSASGGVTSAILERLLSSGLVDGIITSMPLEAKVGEPHFQMTIIRTIENLDACRSSHYHPLSYDMVLKELHNCCGYYAVVGVPCVLRGLARLPADLQKKLKYKIGLACGKNVTAAFADYLACKEGVDPEKPWRINLRDKVGIPDANNFNNVFEQGALVIRKNRYATLYTVMWRNYFFAQECCFYCPDFYGVDADVSVKDAWGRLSGDPLGVSLVVVNNSEIENLLRQMGDEQRVCLEECDADEVYESQTITADFKHVKIRDRLVWKKVIKREIDEKYSALAWNKRWFSKDSHEYWRLWLLMKLSAWFYARFASIPIAFLMFVTAPLSVNLSFVQRFIRK